METRKTVLITLVTIIIIVITFKYIQFTNSRDVELMKINYCLDYQDVPQVCE